MSVCRIVFLARSRLPTAEAWVRALQSDSFDLAFDPAFDPAAHEGYVPCTYQSKPAGFEYDVSPAMDEVREQEAAPLKARLGDRDTAVTFRTHSSFVELKVAAVAAAVLAELSDGLVWDDEAAELVCDPLASARDLHVPVPAQPLLLPTSIATDLAVRAIYRGPAITVLQSAEPEPRRFTVKLAISSPEARVLAFWERAGSAAIHRLRVGDLEHVFDLDGMPRSPARIDDLIASLGATEAATRGLLAAGPAAVPALCELVSAAAQPLLLRSMAIVILGQIRDPAARRTLEDAARQPELHDVATAALRTLASGDR